MTEPIEIPFSRKNIFLNITGSILFVIAGILLITDTGRNEIGGMKILIIVIGILGILFFAITGFLALKKMFSQKSGLIIDKKGITDNTNASSVGLIEWKDISQLSTRKILTTKFLLIKVKNPEKYIEKAKNGIQAKLMRSTLKRYGTPLSIDSNALRYDFRKLVKLVKKEYNLNAAV